MPRGYSNKGVEATRGCVVLFEFLKPSLHVDSLHDIDYDKLYQNGIKAILLDLDNTIVPWNTEDFSPDILNWLNRLIQKGFKLCIVSNNSKERVMSASTSLGIPAISNAVKPRTKALRKALELLDVNKHETALIGDQVFTDVLGGNRLGLYTILVAPLAKKEFIGTKINRFLERLILKRTR